MDEMNTMSGEGQSTSASSPVTSSAPESSYSSSQSDERLFKQSEINDIVSRAKRDAVEGYKRKSERSETGYNDQYASQTQHTSSSPTQYLSHDDVRRMAAEESQRLRDEWINDAQRTAQENDAQRIVGEFFNKLSTGKDKYQDFEKVVGDVDYGRFPNVVQLLNNYTDNLHDVMYDLGKDRSKLATLEQLCQISPRDAIVQAQRLSQSIRDNEGATKIRSPHEPLSQMRPSNTGTDNGAMSVKDYRKIYRA